MLKRTTLLILCISLLGGSWFLQGFFSNYINCDFIRVELWNIASIPNSIYNNLATYFKFKHTLEAENKKLKLEQKILHTKIYRLAALQLQNKELRELLSSSKDLSGDFIVSQLITVLKQANKINIIINKGKNDGVYLGQPVLDGFGVLGQVISLYPNVAKVQLITDTSSAIPVMIASTGIRGILRGIGRINTLHLIDVNEPEKLAIGQILLTSGLGLQFTKGYPVGVITKIEKIDEFDYKVTVKPSAHLYISRQFLLVWPEQAHWMQYAKQIINKTN